MKYTATNAYIEAHYDQKILIGSLSLTVESSLEKLLIEISNDLLIAELKYLYDNRIYDPKLKFDNSKVIDDMANAINKVIVHHYDLIHQNIRVESNKIFGENSIILQI